MEGLRPRAAADAGRAKARRYEESESSSPEPEAGSPEPERFTQFSGLETLTIRPDSNFQMIGERTNITGSARFARLIREEDYGTAVEVALDQVRGGANILDVNMDEGMIDSVAAMRRFLNILATEPEVARGCRS